MPAFLLVAWNFVKGIPWQLIAVVAVAVVVSALWYRGDYYHKRAAKAEAMTDEAIDINEANARIFKNYRQEDERLRKLLEEGGIRKIEIHRAADERRKAINNVLPSQDAPLAPVLRDELNGLPNPQTGDPGVRG